MLCTWCTCSLNMITIMKSISSEGRASNMPCNCCPCVSVRARRVWVNWIRLFVLQTRTCRQGYQQTPWIKCSQTDAEGPWIEGVVLQGTGLDRMGGQCARPAECHLSRRLPCILVTEWKLLGWVSFASSLCCMLCCYALPLQGCIGALHCCESICRGKISAGFRALEGQTVALLGSSVGA